MNNVNKPWNDHAFGVLAEIVQCEVCLVELDPRENHRLCKYCLDLELSKDIQDISSAYLWLTETQTLIGYGLGYKRYNST